VRLKGAGESGFVIARTESDGSAVRPFAGVDETTLNEYMSLINTNLSMRAKLVLCIVPVIGAVCLAISLPFLSRIKAMEEQAVSERVETISAMTVREIGTAMRVDEARELGRTVDSLGVYHDLQYLVVMADPATTLAAYEEDEARARDFQKAGPQSEQDASVYKLAFPVARKKHANAMCYVGIQLSDLHAASAQARSSLAMNGLLMFLGGIALVFGSILLIGRPLTRVVKIAEDAARGNLQARAPARSKDEAGRLATALNTVFLNVETTGKRIDTLAGMLNNRDKELANEVDRRKLIEKQIQLSNQIINKAGALILVANSTGSIDYASPSFRHVLGYAPDQLLQDGWWKVTIPESAERIKERNHAAKCACGQVSIRQAPYERQIGDAAGRLRWILWQDTVGLNKTLIKVGQDITERKLAEEQIREQAALLDITGDAIIVRNLEDSILFWNRGAEKLYGVSQSDAVGKSARDLFQQESSEGIGFAYTSVVENGAWVGELKQETRDGRKLLVESRWTLMNDNEGKPKSILVVNTDVTEQRQLESQFRRTQRLENIGTLAGGIAHDLNNVLTPILMSIEALQKRHSDEKTKHLLSMIDLSARRGADIVKQVLTFARGSEGERTLLQPKHILREVERIVRETFPKSIDLQCNIPSNLWTIIGDATQLHQIILNLLVNARDAMPQGGKLLLAAENVVVDEGHVRQYLNAKPGNYVGLSVTDSGTGISPEVLDKIFDPFFTTKEVGKGTGLGLSTVMTIVKSYGGLVTVNSAVGKGTTFNVFIPAMNVDNTRRQKDESQRKLPSGHGESILVVDDEVSIREITKETLEAYGYKIQTAKDGVEALTYIEKNRHKVRLVLTDMMMPNMDGGSLIRTLQRLAPEIKIVVVSGLTDPETLDKIKSSRVEAFLPKPIKAENLLKILDTILNSDEEAKQEVG
jgi:PAS domain S-box-containing protein